MIIIEIDKNETLERALKRLKKKVIKTKQNAELFERREFTKKSVKRREQIKKAKYRQKMQDLNY